MKVFVQIVDTKTGIYQSGMIDEPVKPGFEIANAIGHFGVNYNSVDWIFTQDKQHPIIKYGEIRETSKVINVIMI